MKFSTKSKAESGIPPASLPDIVFMLLIFFMVSSTFVKDMKLDLERPGASSASRASSKVIRVYIDNTGETYVDGQPVKTWAIQGKLRDTFATYPQIGTLLPAMGYGEEQLRDLEATIAAADCDAVVIGTPIDLNRIVKIDKPTVRVRYELQELGTPTVAQILEEKFGKNA